MARIWGFELARPRRQRYALAVTFEEMSPMRRRRIPTALRRCLALIALPITIGCDRGATTRDPNAPGVEPPVAAPQELACQHPRPTPEDAAMPCGLPEVRFAAGQGDLDPVARCQLIAVAPCIVSHRFYVQLKAHASADEVASEEAAILLSDQRSSAVRTILMNHGVRCESVTSLAVGDLQPTGREADEDRRVEIRLIPASGTDGLVPLAATGCPPE